MLTNQVMVALRCGAAATSVMWMPGDGVCGSFGLEASTVQASAHGMHMHEGEYAKWGVRCGQRKCQVMARGRIRSRRHVIFRLMVIKGLQGAVEAHVPLYRL
jgi:hypothetical protein